jgi:hypothetical protein
MTKPITTINTTRELMEKLRQLCPVGSDTREQERVAKIVFTTFKLAPEVEEELQFNGLRDRLERIAHGRM